MKTPNQMHPLVAAVGTLFFATVAFVSGVEATAFLNKTNSAVQTAAVAEAFPAPLALNASLLIAKAAVVYDPSDGRILYAKNSSAQLPLASLAKLMTATAVLEHASPTTPVSVDATHLKPAGDWGLKPGDTMALSALLKMSLIASSNDAMAAAASSLGGNPVAAINKKAQDLGLSSVQLSNATGLDETSTEAGAYGSAYDVARLASLFYAKYPEYFALTTQPDVSIEDGDRTLSASATALPLADVPGLIGAKTGYTDLAGGNLVAVFDITIGHPLVAVVLGSTQDGRFSDMKILINAIRAQVQ